VRHIRRTSLPSRAASYLRKKQHEVTASNARAKWKAARDTKTMASVFATLTVMAGSRARCMFCSDSRGADIDHFWPIKPYHRKTFAWENHLLVCTACNRRKGDRFALDSLGLPLLIDPTTDDPWDFLFFDTATGNVTARFEVASGLPNSKGQHTSDPFILPLNVEAVTDGRRRIARNLQRAVEHFLAAHSQDGSVDRLLYAIRDNDDYGLAIWYFHREGAREAPFSALRSSNPDVWSMAANAAGGSS
jgi:uncharacterized protein (TIGR02646 family)